MRFLSAFRAESAAQDRARDVIPTFAWVLLAIFPWLLSLAGPGHRMPPFSEAALAPCLAATILLARSLYEDSGERRRFHWLLPDADQAWIMLAPALLFVLCRCCPRKIGRAHVCTPVTNAHLVCRLLLA